MRIRIALCVVLLAGFAPGIASAAQGILLLADEGTPEWNAQVTQLAARVDEQKPTGVAFWPATTSKMQAVVDRLVQRDVSEIVVVPLFIASPPSDLGSEVKSSVPLRVTAGLGGNPVVMDILLDRAQQISTAPSSEMILLASHRTAAGADERWVPDLGSLAQQMNRTRRFAAILTTTLPPGSSGAPANEVEQLRRMLERQVAMGRRILVVPVSTSYGGPEAALKEQLHGLPHDVAKTAVMPDDRLVAWIISRAEAGVAGAVGAAPLMK